MHDGTAGCHRDSMGSGLMLERLPSGTCILLGDTAIVELTGLRTPCSLIDPDGPRSRQRSPRIISHDEVANALSRIADIVVTIVQVTLESWSCQNGLRHVGPGG